MSKTLLNRLAMFETLDSYGPLTVTELSRRCGLDLTVVSRTVTACEPDGWLSRVDGKVTLGPRCALLAHGSASAQLIAASEPIVHAVAGATGLSTNAVALIGNQAVPIATAPGRSPTVPVGLAAKMPLHAVAAGRAVAALLDPRRLDGLLPPEPFPDAATIISAFDDTAAARVFSQPAADPGVGTALPRNRAELDTELDQIRATGYATDTGALHPAIHCIAVPWPQPALPTALTCIGSPADIHDGAELVLAVLRVAVRPGATPHDIIAAGARHATGDQ